MGNWMYSAIDEWASKVILERVRHEGAIKVFYRLMLAAFLKYFLYAGVR
jgi:hypothetical protein